MKKGKALTVIGLIYLLAYALGVASSFFIENTIMKFFVFDTVATIVTFIFSVILRNSSVYDAYWSVTPMVMSIWLFIENRAFSVFQLIFLVVFNIWGARLTTNWINVFTDFSYEDWRYTKFRNETPKFFWSFVNFFGIHYLPTLFVFAGFLPVFVVSNNVLGPLSLIGDAVILLGVLFEHLADKAMHTFLSNTKEKTVCKTGLWKYSRHPNYLGEITVWFGVFIAMLPYDLTHWYYCIGFISVAVMFNIISIPLMEKRQLARRPEYAEYKKNTSRLLLLPVKK